MTVSPDLYHQNFKTVQDQLNTTSPNTIASAASIELTNFLTFLTGTEQLETITPPVTGVCMVALVFTNAAPGAFVTTGNIQRAFTPLQNVPVLMIYDPVSALWWVVGYAS